MGAGSRKDHYMQDTGEKYIVFRLQKICVERARSISGTFHAEEEDYRSYAKERGVYSDFQKSPYKSNVDLHCENFFKNLIGLCPDQKFDFVDVEKEYRDLKMKGDFAIEFEDGRRISISLKNYKGGFSRPQLCSGTWNSFINNFLFKSSGVGMFEDPINKDGERWKGSNREKRNSYISQLGHGHLAEAYAECDMVLDKVRNYYIDNPHAENWKNVKEDWKRDCKQNGLKAAKIVCDAINKLPTTMIKERVLEMAGLNGVEELLMIDDKNMMCSLWNENYRTMIRRCNGCEVTASVKGKGILFVLWDDEGEIIDIEVPFTLQKNGGWYLPTGDDANYKGTRYHEKEKVELYYGQRRPKKVKELSTSTNTYLNLQKAGLYPKKRAGAK